jgi:hypothetical protein
LPYVAAVTSVFVVNLWRIDETTHESDADRNLVGYAQELTRVERMLVFDHRRCKLALVDDGLELLNDASRHVALHRHFLLRHPSDHHHGCPVNSGSPESQ